MTLSTPLGDQLGPIEHFPELIPFIAGSSPQPLPISDKFVGPRPYAPNHIPLERRVFAGLLLPMGGIILWGYISTGKTVLSAGKHGPKIEVIGWWGLPMAALTVGLIIIGLTTVIDHYDKRPNENLYRRWLDFGIALAFGGKIAALIVIYTLKSP